MATIDNSLKSAINDIGLAKTEPKPNSKTELGQKDFLNLMITQLRSQDPFKPMENGQFIAQMAQFSSVSSLQDLQTSFGALASSMQSNQALQASTMVGRTVLAPTSIGVSENGAGFSGVLQLPNSSNDVRYNIVNRSGEAVRSVNLELQQAGEVPFSWDGKDDEGNVMPHDQYKIVAQSGTGESSIDLATFIHAKVDSVTLNKNQQGITLNLKDLGSVAFSDVREIS